MSCVGRVQAGELAEQLDHLAGAGERSGKSDTTMNMVLRPGEALVWQWGQLRPLKYHDGARGLGTLRWKANPVGRASIKYRVYGSDEKGFTIADQRHQSVVGVTKEEMADWNPWFPANFIAEITATGLAVLGVDVDLAAANKTYYRVVAVDEQGKRSGPSDYAVAPRPVVYSKPVLTTRVGAEYRYHVLANRSLGDLSSRMADDRQTSGYFDVEKPRFTLTQGPAWLKIDEAGGVLSGTPDGPGSADVVVIVTIDRQVRKLDEPVLRWGREKILSVETQRVGVAIQEFVIDIAKAPQQDR